MVSFKFAGTFEASFYHKTFSGMLRDFSDAGLSVVECVEPAPVPEAKTLDPHFWEVRSRFPLFILFKLVTSSDTTIPTSETMLRR